ICCSRQWSFCYVTTAYLPTYHPDSLYLLLPLFPVIPLSSSSVSCIPFSLIVNLVWPYAWCGESTIIAILSRPAFLRKILYLEACPMILPPAARVGSPPPPKKLSGCD